jgi:hypothetical protein
MSMLERSKWRRSEWLSIGTILVVLSAWWRLAEKSTLLAQTMEDIQQIKPALAVDKTDIAVLKEAVLRMDKNIEYIRQHIK